MLYLFVQNVTSPKVGVLAREDGTADYDVAVQINNLELAAFSVYNFPREDGWAELLARIAEEGKLAKACSHRKPKAERRPCAKCQPGAYKEWIFRQNIGYTGVIPKTLRRRLRAGK